MKRTSALLALSLVALSFPAFAQGPASSVADLPLFQAMAGKRTESGALVLGIAAEPLQGSATTYGQVVLAGLWFELDGAAEQSGSDQRNKPVVSCGSSRGSRASACQTTDDPPRCALP